MENVYGEKNVLKDNNDVNKNVRYACRGFAFGFG